MIGGLFKSASRLALVAAAGVLVGGVSAQAADLGGDCCADLEERVAELEATTVRKGNRKVSLQLSGQVHESIMFWDDGAESTTYAGVNHINSSSRFRFLGEAKINPQWSAGYLMEIETQGKSDSNDMNQLDQNNGSGTGLVVRHNAWWIDHKQYGRVWVGLTDPAGTGIDGINLSNSNIAANAKAGLTNSSFRLRGPNNEVSALTWATQMGGNNMFTSLSDETRHNVIKYVSPTVMGFIFSAAWGEDDFWDVALRYAGEFSGFKLAAGVTYAKTSDANVGGAEPNQRIGAASNHFQGCTDMANFTLDGNKDRDCESWTVGASVMHVATGLFLAGSYGERNDNLRIQAAQDRIRNGAVLGHTGHFSDTDTFWQVRGGIEQNWFGIGKTTLFGEYMNFSGTPVVAGNLQDVTAANLALIGITDGVNGTIASSTVSVWGLGVVQTIDAAAMDLYLTYRNYDADVRAVQTTTGDLLSNSAIQSWQAITFGGRIQF